MEYIGVTANSLKRRLDVSETSDSENIDPLLGASPSKRTKGSQMHNGSIDNTHIFAKPALIIKSPAKARSGNSEFATPARPIRGHTSLSAPLRAPAGRSPKAKTKSVKAFGRRSLGYCRVDPPTISKRNMPRAPFSIADALNGTFTVSRPVVQQTPAAVKTRRPKAWEFEIHTDTAQDEMANLMEHSTCVLDISDDEEKQARDTRGKENIPPPQLFDGNNESTTTQQPATATRNVEMGDEPRSPLGELDVKSFVPEGEDISSVIEIPEDDEETPAEEASAPVEQCLDIAPKEQPKTSAQPELLTHSAIAALLDRTAPEVSVEDPTKKDVANELAPGDAEIEIWESASAAEEALTAVAEADKPADSTAPLS
ncbi:uncharacterized protein GIQ15_06719 [Arthroderma uncinatum]|uniref:uncharacterized protein n=1 Tax=Arthroderma uncinatum TaxID=74035 RepID=UPI00144A58FB|nr:uncharacterized protein GIQ15_06719 [Arthroderma uncinatum]KAF3479743.1 hypothetical protein GIQ15_06719 [Arthroderma uncinatum]